MRPLQSAFACLRGEFRFALFQALRQRLDIDAVCFVFGEDAPAMYSVYGLYVRRRRGTPNSRRADRWPGTIHRAAGPRRPSAGADTSSLRARRPAPVEGSRLGAHGGSAPQ